MRHRRLTRQDLKRVRKKNWESAYAGCDRLSGFRSLARMQSVFFEAGRMDMAAALGH